METECARECGKLTGTVISTGGGVILREENMQALKRNGLVIFMDRKPEEILGEDLSDRPLVADDRQKNLPSAGTTISALCPIRRRDCAQL